MDLNLYSDEALKTATDHGPVGDFIHGALGLGSELGEFSSVALENMHLGKPYDETNLKEELGDLLWYVNLIVRRTLNIPLVSVPYALIPPSDDALYNIEYSVLGLAHRIGDLLDFAKKNFAAGKPLDSVKIGATISSILTHMETIRFSLDFSWDEIALLNIQKLAKRYPEGYFTLERSDNRDVVAERKILEGDQ